MQVPIIVLNICHLCFVKWLTIIILSLQLLVRIDLFF